MPHTFVLASDSFKESMTAAQACQAMQRGLQMVFNDAHFIHVPMADGGEGTVDALLFSSNGQKIHCEVTGPLVSQKVQTYFGVIDHGQTAVIEMAKANGIHLLEPAQRNPMLTTTLGTGEMIKAALDLGVAKIIIGLGGSVTNDAGAGMAQALGAKFLDINHYPVPLGGGHLHQIESIDLSALDVRLQQVEIMIASDVTNPLCGEQGGSHVFAAQKGATPEMIKILDHNLAHFADVLESTLAFNKRQSAGAGAAGGLGFGLMVFAGAALCSGVELVIEYTQLAKKMAYANYVFTGEGRIDFQTKFGKTPFGVAQLAQRLNKPVIACAGSIGDGIEELYSEGFSAILGIVDGASDLHTALKSGEKNLERTCENIARILALSV